MNICTTSPFWFLVSLLRVMKPRSGLEREGVTSSHFAFDMQHIARPDGPGPGQVAARADHAAGDAAGRYQSAAAW